MSARLTLVVVIILFQNYQQTTSYHGGMVVHGERNKIIYNHTFLNISDAGMTTCLQYCLANCVCRSFQICNETACQLCTTTMHSNPFSVRQVEGCTNYDFEEKKGSNEQFNGNSCRTGINCCMTSNPCLNGGSCLPPKSGSKKRFRCKCVKHYTGHRCETMKCWPGYTGQNCEQPIRSCRWYGNGSREPGIYALLKPDLTSSFKVYCDFEKNSTMTWTLVQSVSLQKSVSLRWSSFTKDIRKSQNHPSWSLYRISNKRMQSVLEDSTKWRTTCRYDTDGVLLTDYVRASTSELNILTFENETCVNVEYINIRGQECHNCTVRMFQRSAILHVKSYKPISHCSFRPTDVVNCENGTSGLLKWESNFGFYGCVNPEHRCTSSPRATTQTWFGGKL